MAGLNLESMNSEDKNGNDMDFIVSLQQSSPPKKENQSSFMQDLMDMNFDFDKKEEQSPQLQTQQSNEHQNEDMLANAFAAFGVDLV